MAQIHDFHAHIYYDADQVDTARALAAEVQRQFGVRIGHSTSPRSGRIRADRAR